MHDTRIAIIAGLILAVPLCGMTYLSLTKPPVQIVRAVQQKPRPMVDYLVDELGAVIGHIERRERRP
jgi:hypothetical protein